jgi:hypothetical protein
MILKYGEIRKSLGQNVSWSKMRQTDQILLMQSLAGEWGMTSFFVNECLIKFMKLLPASSRVCPGRYLADRVVFHMVTTIISLYKLEPLEGNSLPDPQTTSYTQKLVQYVQAIQRVCNAVHWTYRYRLPTDFECQFILRDEKAKNLLKAISLGEWGGNDECGCIRKDQALGVNIVCSSTFLRMPSVIISVKYFEKQ